jgi:hypothetical protein
VSAQVQVEYLIEMCGKEGLTQVEVAEAVGFPATRLCSQERCRRRLAVARAGDCGADAVDDLVCFALGDLDELVLQVAALSRN